MNYKQWDFQLWNTRKAVAIDDDSGVVNVLTAGSPAEVSLVDRFGTAASNPLTMTDGRFTFYTAKTVTSVDLAIQTATGHALFLEDVSSSEHRIDIDPDRREQTLIVPYFAVSDTTVTDTGFDLLTNMIVKDVYIKVASVGTNVTNATLDVGPNGANEHDDFLAAISVTATGIVQGAPAVTAGSNAHWIGATTYGVSLANATTGTDVTTDMTGAFVRKVYRTTANTNLAYQHNVTTGSVSTGYIFIDYTRIPT